MILHIFTVLIGFNLCTDKNDEKNAEHKENSVTSNNSQQLLRPEGSHSETLFHQQIQSHENVLHTSSMLSQQPSTSTIVLPTQDEPLDLTTSSRQRGKILPSSDRYIRYRPFIRPWEIIDDQNPRLSAQKKARFDVFAQLQEKTIDLQPTTNQSGESTKRKQEMPSRRHQEFKDQLYVTAGQPTRLENLHCLGACALERINYLEQQHRANQLNYFLKYANSLTLNDIFLRYGHLIEQSKLTAKSFYECRENVQKKTYTFENFIDENCALISLKYNQRTNTNELIAKDMFFQIDAMHLFKPSKSVINFFGSSYKIGAVRILCTFLIPEDFIYETIDDVKVTIENKHIQRIKHSYLNVTMVFWELFDRKSGSDDTCKLVRRCLFHIPLPEKKNLSIQEFFIGFHNGQALLFRYIATRYNNLRFAIELLNGENCKLLSQAQIIHIS